MKNILNFIKKYKKYFIIGAPVLLVVLYLALGRGGAHSEGYVVKEVNVEQSVMLSGKVQTRDMADLGFASSGRLGKIYIKNNQNVREGQILAQLEIGDLLADLKIKQLNSQTSSADLEDAKEQLEKITQQENTKVENAYRTLLTEGLELVPDSNTYDVDAPTLGGIYNDTQEGQYKVIIKKENPAISKYTLLTFNLEKTKQAISEEKPAPLGTKGLYISFPSDEEISSYTDTTWFLDIPNKTSSLYLQNFNAYNEAKDERDLAIKSAQAEYQRLLAEDGGGDSIALAEIQKINANIRKNTIYAPFDGKVTNIEKEVGENASVGERVISILGENKLEVVLQVSELDVSKLALSLPIKISIDALPEEDFYGTLKTVNSRETEIDGVPVYEAFVELEPDPRIKTGMSAKGTIILATKENVLAVPTYAVKKTGDANFVEVILPDGSTAEREVTLGLVGTDSMVEIISGLHSGEKIVINADEK